MEIETFIQTVAPKIGPSSTFDLLRDVRLRTLEILLIEKLNITQDEIDQRLKQQLSITAGNITSMPPIPK